MMLASLAPYIPIAFVIIMLTGGAVVALILAQTIGPKRSGPVKDSAYESGMPIIQDTQRRFNIRFYVVAVLFLLFDVEVALFWPWVLSFYVAVKSDHAYPLETGLGADKGFLLVGMAIFFVLLVFGLLYEWKKGAFQWD